MAATNYKGQESEQSKERKRKKKAKTPEGLVQGLKDNKGHLPTKATERDVLRKKKRQESLNGSMKLYFNSK